MTPTAPYVSLHDQRVRLVADALLRNSDLSDDEEITLAGHALDALNHIPEVVR